MKDRPSVIETTLAQSLLTATKKLVPPARWKWWLSTSNPSRRGYRASELTGRSVMNDVGDRIGTIDDLVVDQERVLFAILEIGGFLGIGERLVAVPYESLELNESGMRIVLPGASKEALE